ncbi:protein kinase [Clostridium botulinum]|uniref:ABC1 kinase family protein n=1 Tax=Clostridium botulinum TaxID=1491 RepID=UPI000174E344|nr:lipopolysaccharide core heptose(II) kinase RfaY [Clostridium botulinum]ACD53135.1 ABC1 family protein kinase [Clostridium botulinum E3 str. Alaska E43]AJF28212.1 protein kinase [Clostridium botulinum]AJF31272.1 protein kinase [Clostridium botulinum]MBN1047206.1 AarF/ABC1/UbiB kinase family protein [Clostridium botulinum]MBY6790680.1 AarF/ABC1/UbiB kinase family protein [Clostridium botulinum]
MAKQSSERFKKIIKVFASYGFGYIFDSKQVEYKKSPANLRNAFEELGPTFIKLGQILSTRPDILPKEYIDELVKLQDSAPQEDFEVMKSVLEGSLNISLEEYFEYVNISPIASASIAQVYEGILKDGRNVVIKIQRPDIYENMHLDIAILMRIFKFTKSKNTLPIDPIEALQEIKITADEELDFISEGKNIEKFRFNNKNVLPIYAPYVVKELLSDKVIVLEKIDGFKINDLQRIKDEGYNNKDIAKKLALSYCKQVFKDGFFHGDPHPGNLLIDCGKICFIDFGIVGQLNDGTKKTLNSIMLAIATKDKEKLIEYILSVSIKKGKVNRMHLYDGVSYMFDTYLATSIKNIKISVLLQEIFYLTKESNLQLPRELVSLIRGVVILEGVIAEIDPELEIIDVVVSFIKAKNKDIIFDFLTSEELIVSLYSFGRDGIRIPSKVSELLTKMSLGEAKLQFVVQDKEYIFQELNKMVNRMITGLLIASLIIGSSLVITKNVGPKYNGVSLIGVVGYSISTIFALILLINMIKYWRFNMKK